MLTEKNLDNETEEIGKGLIIQLAKGRISTSEWDQRRDVEPESAKANDQQSNVKGGKSKRAYLCMSFGIPRLSITVVPIRPISRTVRREPRSASTSLPRATRPAPPPRQTRKEKTHQRPHPPSEDSSHYLSPRNPTSEKRSALRTPLKALLLLWARDAPICLFGTASKCILLPGDLSRNTA